MTLKPGEAYPRTKINDINSILKSLEVEKKKQQQSSVAAQALEKYQQSQQKKTEGKRDAKEQEVYLSELARKYGEGIHEETIMDGNKKIITRVVVKGPDANEYKCVIHPWGGVFYFKNEISITESLYRQESQPK